MTPTANGGATGPRTPKGKAIASMNALRHGVLSRTPVLPDEDEQVFLEFRTRLLDALCPEGELEFLLADRAVVAAWRLQRLQRVEAGILAWHYYEEMGGRALAAVREHETDLLSEFSQREVIVKDAKARDAALQELARVQALSRQREDVHLGRAFVRDAAEVDALGKLARYETGLERSLYRTLGELRRVQSARQLQGPHGPSAVDAASDADAGPTVAVGGGAEAP